MCTRVYLCQGDEFSSWVAAMVRNLVLCLTIGDLCQVDGDASSLLDER